MPAIIETYMTPDELREPDTPGSSPQTSEPSELPKVSNSNSSNSDTHTGAHRSHHAGSHRSSSGGSIKHKSRKSKKRNNYTSHRTSVWSRISAPYLQCRRCGERYRASWSKDTRCPKCGRHPMKIQPWESALYALIFPAALLGAIVHYGRSPRNAAIIFCVGLAGLLVETVIYFAAQ